MTTSGTVDNLQGVVVHEDGRILGAGISDVGAGHYDVAMVQLTSAGVVDTNFSTDGIQMINPGDLDSNGTRALAVDSLGKVYMTARTLSGVNGNFGIYRFWP